MNFLHSIKFRFTLWYLLVLAITLIFLCAGVYVVLFNTLYKSLDDSLEKNVMDMVRDPGAYDSISRGDVKQTPRDLLLIAYYSGDELVKLTGPGRFALDDESIKRVIRDKRVFFTISPGDGEDLRCFGTWLPPENTGVIPRIMPRDSGNVPVVLIMGRPTGLIDESLSKLLIVFLLAIPVCLVFAGGSGIFLAQQILKPVDTIAQTAREIEESDLSRRVDVKTKDELGRLALTLNQMIDRLEKAFIRQKEFTSDASHELRAPLAIIQAESTLALQKDRDAISYRQSLETVSQEVDNMAKIIDQLLMLARSDAGKEQMYFEEIDLGELLRGLTSDVTVLCQDKGLSLELNAAKSVSIKGDRGKLRRLFLNVLDNAIRYTPGGGAISIQLSSEGQTALVAIKDTGIGIPREHLSHIFDRFYRVDKARSRAEGGSGLGLAICKQILEAHGGVISVESQVGKGSVFSIRLPLGTGKTPV
jgi:heavy metal sensor kinase